MASWANFGLAVTAAVFACEILGTGLAVGAVQLVINAWSPRSAQETPLTWLVGRAFPAVASCGCLVIAGTTLLARDGGGLYWLLPGGIRGMVLRADGNARRSCQP